MSHTGRLKIFLGYASGVGKSRRMIEEAVRRRERGQDVVIGALQSDIAPEIRRLADTLEVIPLVNKPGSHCLDVEAILLRKPQICIVDGLAYDNPEGCATRSRWQDVEALLANHVSVVGSINVQYIAEQQDAVESITGKRSPLSVPQDFVLRAEEIVIVDAPAEPGFGGQDSLLTHADRDKQTMLSRLRELALVLVANAVDKSLESYLKSHDIHGVRGAQERILICFTPRTNAHELFENGRAAARRFHGELLAAYVRQNGLTAQERATLQETMRIAHEAGARVEVLEAANDPVKSILDFARAERVTQIFIGHSVGSAFRERWFGTPTSRLVKAAGDIDVQIFPH